MSDMELYNYLKKYFTYDCGKLERSDRKNSNGSLDKDGYLIIKIKGKQYKAHRLIFFLFNERMPDEEIDHINRIRTDNRIENLRESSRLENIKNSIGSGYGIYLDNTNGLKKKYAFKLSKKTYRFYSLEDAIKAKLKMGGKINNEYTFRKTI